jgi:hypothetical protein
MKVTGSNPLPATTSVITHSKFRSDKGARRDLRLAPACFLVPTVVVASCLLRRGRPAAGATIEHGDVVKDGHTIGGSDTERLMVRHAPQGRLSRMPVLRVALTEGQ